MIESIFTHTLGGLELVHCCKNQWITQKNSKKSLFQKQFPYCNLSLQYCEQITKENNQRKNSFFKWPLYILNLNAYTEYGEGQSHKAYNSTLFRRQGTMFKRLAEKYSFSKNMFHSI